MEKPFQVLFVSSQVENKRTLLGVCRDLPVKAHTAYSFAQAKQFLSSHPVGMVFCDELLPDGSYREVLAALRTASPAAHFVLVMRDGEWREYLEALRLGVQEVLRPPLLSIDIDLAFIHSFQRIERELVSLV